MMKLFFSIIVKVIKIMYIFVPIMIIFISITTTERYPMKKGDRGVRLGRLYMPGEQAGVPKGH
jgi:uncharacterized alpha/beta hydrolase family protein